VIFGNADEGQVSSYETISNQLRFVFAHSAQRDRNLLRYKIQQHIQGFQVLFEVGVFMVGKFHIH
jgi:hypothetical protein